MSATSVGQIGLDLVVNQTQFKKQMSGITSLAKKAGAALAAAFAVKKVVDFGRECIELGSDLAEVQNVVDVTFPAMTAQVDAFAKSAASSFGLSETMAKKFTGTFGAMAKAVGFSESAAYDMGTTLTGLAGDVASFYNISQDEAYTKLKSVFTGETETLKDLSVVMTQNALDAYAMANGYGKVTAKMSEAEKVALRYAFVQDQLTAATGDFARTSDSWANQVRVMKLQFDSLKATLGQGLINLFTPVLKVINSLLGKLATLASAFKSFTELITGNKSSSGSGVGNVAADAAVASTGLGEAADSANNLADNTTGVGKAAKKAAKDMKALMGFDAVNKIDKPDEDDDSGSSGGGVPAISGGGAGVDFGSLAQGETVVDKLDSKFVKFFEDVKRGMQPTIDAFGRLWNEGLAKLGNFTWTALKDFYNGFLVPVGKWVFGEGIPRFIDALNNGLMKVDFQKINDALKRLWDALTPFAINVGEGLLWFWENVLVPLGTWVANEVVPRFLDTLSNTIKILNQILEALKPLFQWFWDNVLKPLAEWTGGLFLSIWDRINDALGRFADWCKNNPGVIQGITITVGAFFAAWKGVELLSFIQQSGGVIAALGRIGRALFGATAAKLAYKAETMALTAMYAKDFVVSIAQGAAALAKQAAQFVITTAAKIADTAAQIAMTAATVAWNAVCAIATTVTTALGAAIAFMTSPIGLVILAITALIAIGVAVYKNWDTIKEKALEIWGAIKAWFEETCKAIGDFFSGLWKGITDTFKNVGNWFKERFTAAKDGIHGAFSSIGSWFGDRWSDIKSGMGGVGNWFKDKFTGAMEDSKKAWSNAGTVFGGIWKNIKGAFGNISDWFGDKFSAAWEAVKNVFSKGGEIFSGIKDGILDGLKAVINGLIDGINTVVSIPFNGINSALDGLRSIDIAGFQPFTWLPSIGTPQIPHLAQGGFVERNTPQLAMIGDNKRYGEIVAPEDKMQEMVDLAVKSAKPGITREELESIINNAVMRIIAALSAVGFNLDGEQVATLQRIAQTGIDRRYNTVTIT